MRTLLIDDIRELPDVDVIARTPAGARLALKESMLFEHVIFDHDLGTDTTGYDILSWCIDEDKLPDLVTLITDNPSGFNKMASALENNGFRRVGREFKRVK